MENSGARPSARPYKRSSRFAVAWKVPPQTWDVFEACAPSASAARDSISRAALRVKVSSMMRCGSAPCEIRCATR
jgi:hypothetical protein